MIDDDFEKKVYKKVDDYLILLTNGPSSLYGLTNTSEGMEALKILDRGLINRRTSHQGSVIDITIEGKRILANGGIEKVLLDKQQKDKEKADRETKKFEVDFDNAKRINKFFWLPLAISILSLILAGWKLFFGD